MKKIAFGGFTIIFLGFLSLAARWGCHAEIEIKDPPPLAVTPEENRFGWNEALAQSEEIRNAVARMPEFEIEGVVRDNRTANVRLWDYSKQIEAKVPNYRQEIGDCVSFGWACGVNYLQCVQIALSQQSEFHEAFQPYIYGTSRIQIGKGRLGSGDGSIGAWAAKAVQTYGVLAADADEVPSYAGSVARQWGSRGPPEQFLTLGKKTLVKTVSPVKSSDDVRDAICNGYPVPICSNAGFGSISKSHDRQVGRWTTSWAHCMCLIAYDGSDDGRKAGNGEPVYFCQNSWGPTAHPQPLQGEPPGGFWVRESDVDKIARQGDSYAISSFDGFPAQDIDFHFFRDGIARNSITQQGKWPERKATWLLSLAL
jgi:hypothetical protein